VSAAGTNQAVMPPAGQPQRETCRMSKLSKFILFPISLIATGFALYGFIDLSISLDHARQQQISDHRDAEILRELLELTTKRWNRRDFTKHVKDRFGRSHIVKEGLDQIEVDGIVIQFKDDQISAVRFIDGTNVRGQTPRLNADRAAE
jgi:hypothetical protein